MNELITGAVAMLTETFLVTLPELLVAVSV